MSVEVKNALQRKILLVDDDHDFRWATGNILQAAGHRVVHARNGVEAIDFLETSVPDLVLLDYRMPGQDGLQIAAEMKKRIPAVPIIMITAYGEIDSAVKAMKLGVYDYVTKPVDNNDLLFSVKRALDKQDLVQEVAHLRNVLNERASLYELMGSSKPVKKLVRHVEKVSPTRFTVLIEGESGTGKELVARAIHDLSEVRNGPFVAVDCGAIPTALMESELFGYMKGAFTGAYGDKPGHFELAEQGTLFLDEVGNIAYPVQQKLLRAIQERVIQRLGAKAPLPINVRIVAATNQSLKKDVESGRFRSDLYYRLNEFSVKMPALRERIEDIPYLAGKFMDEVEKELNKTVGGFSKESLLSLSSYHWPGNVRELRNVIRQAVLLCDKNSPVQPTHLTYHSPVPLGTGTGGLMTTETVYDGSSSLKELVQLHTNDLEKKLIREALVKANRNKSEAARNLGVDYKTLLRKIKSLGIAFP